MMYQGFVSHNGQVHANTQLNLRQGAPLLTAPIVGKLFPGQLLRVQGIGQGDSVSGNAQWYAGDNDTYFWPGGCASFEPEHQDKNNIPRLIEIGNSIIELVQAQSVAKNKLPSFPKNGCAANLSALLQLAGIDVPMTLGAGKLAHILRDQRCWIPIAVGQQMAGDVGVTFDNNDPPGADHIYLVVQAIGTDEMIIADNQDTRPHQRFASGHGKTPTDYFLRAAT